jgi:hypothetical protein
MNPLSVKILAGLLIALSLAKLAMLFANPRAWIGFAKRLYARPQRIVQVSLALAALTLYLLLQSGLTMAQILAVTLFVALLVAAGFAPYAARLIESFEAQDDPRRALREQWPYLLAWLLLLGWGACELLGGCR